MSALNGNGERVCVTRWKDDKRQRDAIYMFLCGYEIAMNDVHRLRDAMQTKLSAEST